MYYIVVQLQEQLAAARAQIVQLQEQLAEARAQKVQLQEQLGSNAACSRA
jgi:predicted  nucleic acid-binding Zn-ribbon protein